MCTDQELISAAHRVASAYESGTSPAFADLWTIQLSVSMFDAADLLLGHEELARKIIRLHQPICTLVPAARVRAAGSA